MRICRKCRKRLTEFDYRNANARTCNSCIHTATMITKADPAGSGSNRPDLDDELAAVRPTEAEFIDICHAADAMVRFDNRKRLTEKGWHEGICYRGPVADDILEKYAVKHKYPGSRYIQLAGCAIVLSRYWG